MAYGYSVLWSNRQTGRVVRWSPDTGVASDIYGRGIGTTDNSCMPYGLAVDGADVLVADKHASRIRRISKGDCTTVNSHDGLGVRQTRFQALRDFPGKPTGIAVEPDGALLVTYSDDNTIYRILPDGTLEPVLGRSVVLGGRSGGCEDNTSGDTHAHPLNMPTQTLRWNGGLVFIERGFQVVRQWHPQAGLRCLFPLANRFRWQGREADMPDALDVSDYHPSHPTSLAVDAAGSLFIADGAQRRVWRLDPKNQSLQCVVRSVDSGAAGIAFGPDGTLWMLAAVDGTVSGYSPQSSTLWPAVGARSPGNLKPVGSPYGAGIVCAPLTIVQ